MTTVSAPITARFAIPNHEKAPEFSIAGLAEWDFWAKAGQITVPPGTTPEQHRQIVIMTAIALRDREAPSERRN